MRVLKGGVAFFDSGIGGLTVLSACEKRFDSGVFYYYGDNTHAPYGNLPPKKIKKYVFRVFRKFRRLRVRAAVIACNTATAVCIDELRKKFSFPIIGTEPAVMVAAREGGEVLILCTKATFESERLKKLCQDASKCYPNAKLRAVPCENLAGAIERNVLSKGYDYTPHLPQGMPTAVVLGCTHYIYIKEEIEQFYKCKAVDGNEGIADRLLVLLRGMGSEDKSFEKNWDGCPQIGTAAPKLGNLPTKSCFEAQKKSKSSKSNKRSCFCVKNDKKRKEKTDEKKHIFFLGKRKKSNKTLYKQTFV